MHYLTARAPARKPAPRALTVLLLLAGLAGCGGPGNSAETAGSGAPTVLPAGTPAHDSTQATLTTPAPDATATGGASATDADTVTAKKMVDKPLHQPR